MTRYSPGWKLVTEPPLLNTKTDVPEALKKLIGAPGLESVMVSVQPVPACKLIEVVPAL